MDWRNPDGFPPALNTILRRHKDDVDGIAAAVELSALLTRLVAMRLLLDRIVAADAGLDYRMMDSAVEEARALLDAEKPATRADSGGEA